MIDPRHSSSAFIVLALASLFVLTQCDAELLDPPTPRRAAADDDGPNASSGGGGGGGGGGNASSSGGGGGVDGGNDNDSGGPPPDPPTPSMPYPDAGVDCAAPGEPTKSTTAALVYDVRGFAKGVIGGARACVVHVKTLANAGAGSLRAALESTTPAWIVFDVSGTITLSSSIRVASNKTVDGRGQKIEIENGGFLITDATNNVIVENIVFARGPNAGDAISVDDGAHGVFIDHCSFGPWGDGQLDITGGSTDVTVAWSRFENHGLSMLIGGSVADTGDSVIRVTVHHNWFHATDERHPRLRFGRVHAYNNVLSDWLYYGMASSQGGQIASEANVFVAGANKQAVIKRAGADTADGRVRSIGDMLVNGAVVLANDPTNVFAPSAAYSYSADVADAALRTAVETSSGFRVIARP